MLLVALSPVLHVEGSGIRPGISGEPVSLIFFIICSGLAFHISFSTFASLRLAENISFGSDSVEPQIRIATLAPAPDSFMRKFLENDLFFLEYYQYFYVDLCNDACFTLM